ncbi:hypothetical protein [Xylocopilactobacillus apicola]|uniref:hypothetical protein n=1 Tax=Xylocopilactobacillus apicola TaxID=2932184 RepID=UPI0029538021|nr:hypothetical protein [Xylocopilactobacillus apicola]
MSKIMNKTSLILMIIVMTFAGIFEKDILNQTKGGFLVIIIALILSYFSIWVMYYLSKKWLEIIKRSPVKRTTGLLNMILIITIIGFLLLLSNTVITWNDQLMGIVSNLVTALGYYFFAEKIEKTSPKVAAIYALSIIVIETLLVAFLM